MELTITKPQFEKIKNQALIIDVRDNWEHQQLKKLPNSLNIIFLELTSEPEQDIGFSSRHTNLFLIYNNFRINFN